MPKKKFETSFIQEIQRQVILENPYLKELIKHVMATSRAVGTMTRNYQAIDQCLRRIRVLDQKTSSKTGTDLVFRMKKKRKDAGKKRGPRSKAKLPNNVIPFERGRKKSA